MQASACRRFYRKRCRAHASGAALLETLIVLPVMLTIAFNALEFSRYGQARMVVRYAQVQGMRECTVSGDHPNNPTGDADGNTLALTAAREALRPWAGKWLVVGAMPGCHMQGTGEQAPVDFPIRARYRCSYPLSFCRVMGGVDLEGVEPMALAMPMQTAFYDKRGSTAVDPSTVCRESGGTKECHLTEAGDAGPPPPVVYCPAGGYEASFCDEAEETHCATAGETDARCMVYRSQMDHARCVSNCHGGPSGYTDCEYAGNQQVCASNNTCAANCPAPM